MRMTFAGVFAFAALISLAAGAAPRLIERDIQKYVCEKLDDFSADVTVVKADHRELGKISKDLGLAYSLPNITMQYKDPNMVRMDGTKDGSKVTYILNGTKQIFKLNGLKTTRELGNSPGKRKSLMDMGLISDFYLSYTNARFLREASVDGTPCALFEMTYKDRSEDTSHHNIYVDPVTKVVRKREAYSQDGKLQAIYYYKNVIQLKPGVWVPTQIEVQNTDRVVAGIMAYKNIKVNTGISDSAFKQ